MEHRPVGRSGLRVSALALGTAAWISGAAAAGAAPGAGGAGPVGSGTVGSGGYGGGGSGAGATTATGTGGSRRVDEESATGLFRAFRAAGGTGLDVVAGSAAVPVVGRLVAAERDECVICVRVPAAPAGAGSGAGSRHHLLRSLDACLRQLGTDHIDLWQVPVSDAGVPLDETLATVDHAVTTGRVRYVGTVDHVGWRLARAATWQQAWPGRSPIVSDCVEYSLLARDVELDTLPAARELGLGVLAYAPLAAGTLIGRAQGERFGAGAARIGRSEPRALGIVEAVATAADGLATTAVAVSLCWLRDRPGVSTVVVGARTQTQLAAALAAQDLTLPDAIRSALDDVSAPGPYGSPAPSVSSGPAR